MKSIMNLRFLDTPERLSNTLVRLLNTLARFLYNLVGVLRSELGRLFNAPVTLRRLFNPKSQKHSYLSSLIKAGSFRLYFFNIGFNSL